MPIVDVDLTSAGLIAAGQYTCQVQKVEYHISTTPKDDGSGKYSWKNECVQVVDDAAFGRVANVQRRLHFVVSVPGKPNIFNDLYLTESSLGFAQQFIKACGVPFTKDGFDPEECIGKSVNVEVGIKEGAERTENTYKWSKA